MKTHCKNIIVSCCLVLLSISQAMAESSAVYVACLKDMLRSAPDSMTMGELRALCNDNNDSAAVAGKISETQTETGKGTPGGEAAEALRRFAIMAHRQNYFLAGAHNFNGYSPEEYIAAGAEEDFSLDRTEAQFQISIKTPLAVDLFDTGIDAFAGYTMRAFWQMYNSPISSPFRETNHEPELWLQAYPNYERYGFTWKTAALGLVHQSNGQSGSLSRSWNRIYADIGVRRGDLSFSVKPWLRISEDSEDDDNPDITDYLGHGELRAIYRYADNTFAVMSRNNLESGFSKGAVELSWSFPLLDYPYLKGYIQYFSGYGESLIDYDRYVNKIGIGIMLNDLR